MIGRLRARYAAGRAAGLVGLLAASATLATLAVVSRRRRRSSRGQHVAIAAIAAVIAGCGSQDAELAKTSQPAGKHDIYRARLFTTELRGAARIPVHVDGTDGTSVDITADDDGRLCLTVPEINAGTGAPGRTTRCSAIRSSTATTGS